MSNSTSTQESQKCSFCRQPATEVMTCYTMYTVNDSLPVPFRDAKKHEFAVCQKHRSEDMVANLALSQRRANPTVARKWVAHYQNLIVKTPPIFERHEPIIIDFQPIINEHEINSALVIAQQESTNRDDKAIEGKKQQARAEAIKKTSIFFIVGIASLIFGIIFSFWMALCAGATMITIFPAYFIWRYIELGRPPKQYNTAQAVADKFYSELLTVYEVESGDALLAFQLLSPTAAHRTEAHTIENLQLAWNKVNPVIIENIKSEFPVRGSKLPDKPLTFQRASLIVSPVTDLISNITYECWRSDGHSIWAIVRFHNIAVRVGSKWCLMAGEPGESKISQFKLTI